MNPIVADVLVGLVVFMCGVVLGVMIAQKVYGKALEEFMESILRNLGHE